jgi:hypothetical protein
MQGENIFESIPEQKISDIVSGATPIGSAGRAPNNNTYYESYEAGDKVHCQRPCQKKNLGHKLLAQSLPSGGVFN